MATTKMRLNPPRPKTAEEFVEAANAVPRQDTETKSAKECPWEDAKVRDDVIKSVNLRLPEPYILKLQYISNITNKSQQAIIREILLPQIDAQIGDIIDDR